MFTIYSDTWHECAINALTKYSDHKSIKAILVWRVFIWFVWPKPQPLLTSPTISCMHRARARGISKTQYVGEKQNAVPFYLKQQRLVCVCDRPKRDLNFTTVKCVFSYSLEFGKSEIKALAVHQFTRGTHSATDFSECAWHWLWTMRFEFDWTISNRWGAVKRQRLIAKSV